MKVTSFVLKTLEKLIDRHIRDHALERFPLHRYQYAYQSGKSCELAVHELTSRAEKTLQAKDFGLEAFLDIEGAFDNTSFESIQRAAQHRGIHPTLCSWIENMLKSRAINTSLNETTVRVSSPGDMLSPTLWCLVADGLLRVLEEKGIYAQGYADDITIFIHGKFEGVVFNRMQIALNTVEKWCEAEGLSVNPGKTSILTVTRRRTPNIRELLLFGKKTGGNLVRLSQQALIDCSWGYGNNGCDGGEDFRAYKWMLKHGGIPTEEDYGPYLGQDGYCHADKLPKVAKITGWVNVTTNNENALKLALVQHGPISVAIDASHRTFSFYSNGVYSDPKCGNKEEDLDHAVLAVGYGTINGKDYWLIKNSWSNYWGNDGYVLMAAKDNNCGVMTTPTYVTM